MLRSCTHRRRQGHRQDIVHIQTQAGTQARQSLIKQITRRDRRRKLPIESRSLMPRIARRAMRGNRTTHWAAPLANVYVTLTCKNTCLHVLCKYVYEDKLVDNFTLFFKEVEDCVSS